MSEHVPAGWYPDHTDAGLLRYWDGTQWTHHTHPAQVGSSQPGAAVAGHEHAHGLQHSEQYAQHESGHQHAGHQHAEQQPYSGSGFASPEPPSSSVPGPGERPKTRVGPIIVVAVGVLLIIGALVFVGIGVFSNGDAGSESPPAEQPTDDTAPAQDGDSLVAGEHREGVVEAGGAWEATMTVEDDGVVLIDAFQPEWLRDLTLEVLDSAGEQVAYSDGRGAGATSVIGGISSDPYLALWLDAADYTLVVAIEEEQAETSFELHTHPVDEIGADSEGEFELWENEYVSHGLVAEEAGEHTITAVADRHDVAIVLFNADGTDYTVADPSDSEAVLRQDLEPGAYMFAIADPEGRADTYSVSIEGP